MADAPAHDGEGVQHAHGVASGLTVRRAGNVGLEYQFGAHLSRKTHRHRLDEAAIDKLSLADLDGLESGPYSAQCPHSHAGVIALKEDWLGAVQVGSHDSLGSFMFSMFKLAVCSRT